jgi:hypothetical protein
MTIEQNLGWILVLKRACQFADHFLPIIGEPFQELST